MFNSKKKQLQKRAQYIQYSLNWSFLWSVSRLLLTSGLIFYFYINQKKALTEKYYSNQVNSKLLLGKEESQKQYLDDLNLLVPEIVRLKHKYIELLSKIPKENTQRDDNDISLFESNNNYNFPLYISRSILQNKNNDLDDIKYYLDVPVDEIEKLKLVIKSKEDFLSVRNKSISEFFDILKQVEVSDPKRVYDASDRNYNGVEIPILILKNSKIDLDELKKILDDNNNVSLKKNINAFLAKHGKSGSEEDNDGSVSEEDNDGSVSEEDDKSVSEEDDKSVSEEDGKSGPEEDGKSGPEDKDRLLNLKENFLNLSSQRKKPEEKRAYKENDDIYNNFNIPKSVMENSDIPLQYIKEILDETDATKIEEEIKGLEFFLKREASQLEEAKN